MILEEETIFNDDDNEISCFKCNGDLASSEYYKRFKICSHCNFHFHMSARDRIDSVVDKGTFKEIFNNLSTFPRKKIQKYTD